MAIVDLSGASQTFNTEYLLVTHATPEFNDPTFWQWVSDGGSRSIFFGTSLAYSTSGIPSTGVVTSMLFDLSPLVGTPEIGITGLSIDFGAFARLADSTLNAEQQNNLYWRTILSGDDTIDLGSTATTGEFSITFNGDGRHVEADQILFGGNDTISGDAGNGQLSSISGDFYSIVAGGSVYGGDDEISVSSLFVYGDAVFVSGFLAGGDDMLSMQGEVATAVMVGDAEEVSVGGSVVGGNDIINVSGAFYARGDVSSVLGNLVGGNDTLTGGNSGEYISGDAERIFSGGAMRGGADTIHGGGGGDIIFGDWETLYAGGQARGGNDWLFGDAGNDEIHGNAGNDQIHGGADVDQVFGEDGNDTFVLDAFSDLQSGETYDGGNGIDTFQAGNISVGAGVTLGISLTGVALTSLEGLTYGGVGGGLGETFILNASQMGGGLSLTSTITANVAPDTQDILQLNMGGVSSLDLSGLTIVNFSDPVDFVQVNGDGDAETITGTNAGDQLNGNGGSDTLRGGGGNDALFGGIDGSESEADTMFGGAGDDIYAVDDSGDVVNETADSGSGTDLARSSTISIDLSDTVHFIGDVENARLSGAENLDTTGNGLGNLLTGNNGDNRLNGMGGADTMTGLGGNDTYYVDNDGDKVVEDAGQGTADWVATGITYGLGTGVQVEKLSTTNTGLTSALDLTGNEFAQIITGNAGNNRLNGAGGADTMTGLAGNDTYYVDNVGDKVVEGAGGTADWVATSITYGLGVGVQVERLSTTSSGATTAINMSGNEFAQTITGNAGANRLNGAGGADTMTGLGGNDTYYIDNLGDKVVEGAGQGTADWVATSVSYALAAGVQVEKFSTTSSGATSALVLTGNEFAQAITGNAGANFLTGKGGNDTLIGGAGADMFFFDTALNASTNIDRITDFNVAADTVRLENGIFTQIVGTGTLTAAQFWSSTTGQAHDANDRIIYETDTGKLFYDSNGSASGGSFHFATFTAGLALTNADFFVV